MGSNMIQAAFWDGPSITFALDSDEFRAHSSEFGWKGPYAGCGRCQVLVNTNWFYTLCSWIEIESSSVQLSYHLLAYILSMIQQIASVERRWTRVCPGYKKETNLYSTLVTLLIINSSTRKERKEKPLSLSSTW